MNEAELAIVLAFAKAERVIAIPERFKMRLAIGENVYATRRALRSLSGLWDTGSAASSGAGAAKSAMVAGAFFAPAASANPLVWMGIMAPAAAVTPVGWVVAAAVVAGGAWYGVSRWLALQPDGFVDTVPKFLNEPVDMLGMKLLDLHAGLAFHIACADGHIDNSERAAIRMHFEEEWGYDPVYLDAALPLIEASRKDADLTRAAAALVAFHRASRDCAPEAMQRDLAAFLREIAEADGVEAPAERDALALIERTMTGARALSLKQAASDLADWGGTLGAAAAELAGEAQVRAQGALTTARDAAARGSAALQDRVARLRGTTGDDTGAAR